MLMEKLNPVKYAQGLGVFMNGKVTIYGSSYKMFNTEPFLVTLGDNVYISLDAVFICHDGGTLPFRKDIPDLDIAARINVGYNVFIGVKSLVLPRVTIGNNCIIGACALVTKDVPEFLLTADNNKASLSHFDDVIKGLPNNVIKMQFIQNNINTIIINLVVDEKIYQSGDEESILFEMKNRFEKAIKIVFNYVEEIPREKSGKFALVKNNLKIT